MKYAQKPIPDLVPVVMCPVCLQPMTPVVFGPYIPADKLSDDPARAYRTFKGGKVPRRCISCGKKFRPHKAAIDRFLEFLAGYVSKDEARALELMLLGRRLGKKTGVVDKT